MNYTPTRFSGQSNPHWIGKESRIVLVFEGTFELTEQDRARIVNLLNETFRGGRFSEVRE